MSESMQPARITNPILRGFNPDPSICRAGGDFYIATSTFEWYPGVQIHHSRNLRDWQLVARPLNEARLLNMLGTPDSCGVWAPCLSWADGLFWLVYTAVRRFDGDFKDTPNFVITAVQIDGPWSEPVYLNSSGFDPSLFHADDGRKWLLNMRWDHRSGADSFGGIVMQEYDAAQRCLVGESELLFSGTALGCTEGPHLYRIGAYYYLLTAEGGTGYAHAVTVARSESLHGPWEVDPNGPLVTTRHHADWPLQRAGHGDLVQLDDGTVYLVFLCSRRFGESRHSPLGRESAIQPIELTDDGWFRLPWGDALPRVDIPAPSLPAFDHARDIEHDDFDTGSLNPVYQWLRTPWPEAFYSLSERPGHLRLFGAESPGSLYTQALIARRQTEFCFTAETSMEFEPENFQQMAGLVLYYNASKFHYLYVSSDEQLGKHLAVMSCEADPSLRTRQRPENDPIPLPRKQPVRLRMVVDCELLRFSWAIADDNWRDVPFDLDVRFLTDQAGQDSGEQFTGTFIGVCAHDVSGARAAADFDYLAVRPRAS